MQDGMCQKELIVFQEYDKVRGFIQRVEEFHKMDLQQVKDLIVP